MSRAEPVRDPRIAKKEMIVTRFKSAQQRKQLTDKEQSNKQPQTNTKQTVSKPQQTTKSPLKVSKLPTKVTKLPQTATKLPQTSKSPLPKTKSSRKARTQRSPNKIKNNIPEAKSPILIEDDNPEYYPDKLKRAQGTRKVFLKPKQKSTMIARTNKRKFNTPKRGIKSPLPNQSTFSTASESVPSSQSPVYSELSMAEVIRIVEENDSLDDEDLMEILTCPSPVWWEEPPDEMYIEEAICSRKPHEYADKTKSPIRERCFNTLKSVKLGNKIKTQVSNPETTNDIINEKTEIKKDAKFMKKSKKLENVLGNIKNKACKDNDFANKSIKQEKLDTMSLQSVTEEKLDDVTNITSDTDMVVDTSENISINDKDKAETSNTNEDIKKEKGSNKRKNKKWSESTGDSFEDLSCRSQELWLDFENMNIPVVDNLDLNSPDCIIINDDNSNKIIDIDAPDNKIDNLNNEDHYTIKRDAKDSSDTNTESNSDINISNNTIEQKSKENISETTNNVVDEQTLVPKNMPPLIKCPKFENIVFPSPNSYKSISDITESSSISGVDIMDTISDTNIKFITDDEIDDVSDGDNKNKNNDEAFGDKNKVSDTKDESNRNLIKNEQKNTELNEPAVMMNTNEPKSKDTYITVYKIVPNDETNQKTKNKFINIPEYSSYVENLIQKETKTDNIDDSLDNEIPDIPDSKGQLNSFFKKCKNANRKRKRIEVHDKTDIEVNESTCPSPKKSITVAQEENVKYCMKCSSIFDTEDCSYCLKTQKEPDRSVPEKSFTCDKCDFVGETTNNVNDHLEEHNIEEEAKTP